MLDFREPVAIGDGRAIILEQMVEIEAEAIAGRRDARVHDVQSKLIERGGRAREPVPAWPRKDQCGGGATYAARIERNQRLIGSGIAFRQQLRVPGNLLG